MYSFTLMQHRGEIVEKAVRESGIPLAHIAGKLGKSRRWIYLAFDNPNLSIDAILEIGKIIHHDFSMEIDVMRQNFFSEPRESYTEKTDSVEYWRNKYFELLETYHQLLKSKDS